VILEWAAPSKTRRGFSRKLNRRYDSKQKISSVPQKYHVSFAWELADTLFQALGNFTLRSFCKRSLGWLFNTYTIGSCNNASTTLARELRECWLCKTNQCCDHRQHELRFLPRVMRYAPGTRTVMREMRIVTHSGPKCRFSLTVGHATAIP